MARKKSKKPKKAKKSGLSALLRWSLTAALWCGIFLALVVAWYAKDLPDIARAANFERKVSITVKGIDGTVAARYGDITGDSVGVENLPSHLIYAILAVEDRRFYQHYGLDPLGVIRAMVVNLRHGKVVQGGSTITQQLAKNLFLTHERTFKRKVQEALLALWLETDLTKDEILGAYLNRVYMGSGTYGVDAAAKLYFGKPATDVNLREAATLAGIFKAPSRYSPANNPHLAAERANLVLQSMADAGYITEEEAESATSAPPPPIEKPRGGGTVRYFTDWVVDGVGDLIGTPEEDIIVETTLDPFIQDKAEKALIRVIDEHGEERLITQGAVVIMDTSGAVRAMVGGFDYSASQFNRAVQSKRSPGSSFKTFVYLAAIEAGWTPDDLVYDGRITEGRYRPENYAGEYANAEVSLTTALTYSLNTAAVRVMKQIGVPRVQDLARRLGIFSPLQPDLSLALGSSGVSPLEMVVAYATIANDGYAVIPFAINRITGKDGTVYYQRRESRTSRSVVAEKHVDQIEFMLRSVVETGTGRGAQISVPVAGKTGTSQESRDAWFLGYNDRLVGGVWLGNDDNTPMKDVTGGSFPARIWAETMAASYGRARPRSDLVRAVESTLDSFGNSIESIIENIVKPQVRPGPQGTSHYNP